MGAPPSCRLLLLLTAVSAVCCGVDAKPKGKVPTPTRRRRAEPVYRPGDGVQAAALNVLDICIDLESGSCGAWRSIGYCSPGFLFLGLPINSFWCPATCGVCGAPTTTCPDVSEFCEAWQAAGFCIGSQWTYEDLPINTFWCPATCGRCGGGTGTSSRSPPPPPPPRPPPRPIRRPPPPRPKPPPPSKLGAGTSTGTGWQAELLAMVNRARAQVGAPALCLNARLMAAAQQHSQDMANRRTMTHTGSDGSRVSARVVRQGYAWTAVGENVAYGYPDVRAVFNAWMGSASHRASILNTAFRHMGAGRADASNGAYWAQVFGASATQGCTK